MLGRKQSSSNKEWVAAFENIESIISKFDIDRLTEKTIYEIYKNAKGKAVAYAWSGGKDSVVLEKLCEASGIHKGVMAYRDLEYPEFLKWVNRYKPDGVEMINTGQDMNWLLNHMEALFPPMDYYGNTNRQIAVQNRFYKDNKLDMLVLGRRIADGNIVVKNGSVLYTDCKKMTKYNPIAYWTHEEILAYIHYNNIPLPPIYNWKNGYKIGTHPWYGRLHVKSVEQGWQEIFDIDPGIVTYASRYIESAHSFLYEGVRK